MAYQVLLGHRHVPEPHPLVVGAPQLLVAERLRHRHVPEQPLLAKQQMLCVLVLNNSHKEAEDDKGAGPEALEKGPMVLDGEFSRIAANRCPICRIPFGNIHRILRIS
jgi:hypothetical protein